MDTEIEVGLGYTRNMGNFESLRIDIQVRDYVRKNETTDTAANRVYEFVENKLISKLREIEEEVKELKG